MAAEVELFELRHITEKENSSMRRRSTDDSYFFAFAYQKTTDYYKCLSISQHLTSIGWHMVKYVYAHGEPASVNEITPENRRNIFYGIFVMGKEWFRKDD
jgi:hypothetical protein